MILTPRVVSPFRLRRTPLACCLTAALLTWDSATLAATYIVSNCNDSGIGSLRAEVAAASANPQAGDLINFNLPPTCNSTISITTGAVPVAHPNLRIAAPGNGSRVAITGFNDRIFNVTTAGSTFSLYNLDISDGYVVGSANVAGGCIASMGSVRLLNSSVTSCRIDGNAAYGGAVWTAKNLSLYNSYIADNRATGALYAYGGGVYANGALYLSYSTIARNVALGESTGNVTSAGGASAEGGGKIFNSTISGNASTGSNGGIVFTGPAPLVEIAFSTISGNIAYGGTGGGGRSSAAITLVYASTIAFNKTSAGKASNGHTVAPGLEVTTGSFTLTSSILSNNTYGKSSTPNDLSIEAGVAASGSHNLVFAASSGVPGLLVSACPLLGPLRDNGGPTFTHALLSHSPAIDEGSIVLNAFIDQRGFPNPSPAGGQSDIGAYEVQQDDIVFNAGFDGCQ